MSNNKYFMYNKDEVMYMKQKHIFIIKPNHKSKEIENIIHEEMQKYDYQIYYTKYHHHATKIVAKFKECQHRIYAVGGDGIVHEIVQAMVGTKNELVVLPMGTGNDFARSILDKGTIRSILHTSLSLKAQYIDVIKANDIYCINVFCCAFDSDIANNVHAYRQCKWLPRALQYTIVLLRRLVRYIFYPVKVYNKEEKIYDNTAVIAAFCNARYFGGGFLIGNHANVQDGKMDVHIIKGMKKRNIPKYLVLLFINKLYHSSHSFYHQYDKIKVECFKRVNIDGEVYPRGTYILETITNQLLVVITKENTRP